MSLTDREWWAIIHGMILGAIFLAHSTTGYGAASRSTIAPPLGHPRPGSSRFAG
jgi:hypothetical protein